MLTLHVTNGDSAAQGLARSGLPGDVLAWRDVLHDGPVPADADRTAFREARAQFLSERHWARHDEVLEDFAARDARLESLSSTDAIVLWFEPDLYDQLQLMQVLSQLSQLDASARPSISIVPADLLLGELPPARFTPLYDGRRRLGDEELRSGAQTWAAFTSTSPSGLSDRINALDAMGTVRMYADSLSVRLPHMKTALRRLLEEYPRVDNGLSRTEQQICEVLVGGATTMEKLYRLSHHASESWPWLGDSSFAWYLERLRHVHQPLIVGAGDAGLHAPHREGDAKRYWTQQVRLTPFGTDVVRSRVNAIDANGIDRWIGGVHLTTALHWRWDGGSARCYRAAQ